MILNNVGIPVQTAAGNISLTNTSSGADLMIAEHSSPVLEVQIFNSSGQLIYASQEAITDGVIHLNMMSYADGNYVVRIVDTEKIWAGKVFWHH